MLLLAIVLVALNLRLGITSVGPVIDSIRDGLHLSSTALSLLTTLPVLAFGAMALFAPPLAHRFGAERIVLWCLLGIAAGILIRLLLPVSALFVGTVMLGCGIAIANVLMPGVVKHHFGVRAPKYMGIYTGGLNASGAIAAGLTVPFTQLAGGSWRLGLAAWSIPALLTAAIWATQLRHAPAPAWEPHVRRRRIFLWRNKIAWYVASLMGFQSLLFYTVGAWMPAMLHSHGLSTSYSGAMLSVSMLTGLPSSLILSYIAARLHDQRPVVFLSVGPTAIGLAWLLVAPTTMTVALAIVLGAGLGGNFAVAMSFIVLRSRDARHAAELSGMTQAVGYTIAAVGPLLGGALHDASHGWTLTFIVLLLVTIPNFLSGFAAGRPGFVKGRDADVVTEADLSTNGNAEHDAISPAPVYGPSVPPTSTRSATDRDA